MSRSNVNVTSEGRGTSKKTRTLAVSVGCSESESIDGTPLYVGCMMEGNPGSRGVVFINLTLADAERVMEDLRRCVETVKERKIGGGA